MSNAITEPTPRAKITFDITVEAEGFPLYEHEDGYNYLSDDQHESFNSGDDYDALYEAIKAVVAKHGATVTSLEVVDLWEAE